ncbi:MAG: hypothetical protein HC831_07410 [Chloroflexia bacterium]|nr:hypothetical protein [Chloroflexia bacterium]
MQKLKKKNKFKTIPFVLLTALSENKNQREAYFSGADEFIVKPFDPELLQLKIASLLNRENQIKKAAIVEEIIQPENKTVKTFDDKASLKKPGILWKMT